MTLLYGEISVIPCIRQRMEKKILKKLRMNVERWIFNTCECHFTGAITLSIIKTKNKKQNLRIYGK